MALVYLSLAWIAGIALAARLPGVSFVAWLVPAGLALAGLLFGRRKRAARLAFGCGLLLALGAGRYALARPGAVQGDVSQYVGQGVVTLEGIIADAPDEREGHVNLRVRVERLSPEDGQPIGVTGTVLALAPRFGAYRYGERVRVRGELETPPEFEDFSYRDYLAREGVYSMVRFAVVDVLGERAGSPLRRVMLDFRSSAEGIITRLLPDPQASLLKGILLGVEGGIAPEVRDDFNATGATHVIAISGANLAILAGVLRGVSRRWMRPALSAAVTVVGVLVYALFVGGDAAVMRAFVMASVGIAGAELGQKTFGPASLSFTAVAMTALDPLLLWDVSFLLSFLSTWGIVLYAEPLAEGMERLLGTVFSGETAARIVAASAESVVVTVAAQITTTPIIALFFGRFSVVSLPVNLLIVPAQGPLMLVGGVAVLVAFVVWPLGQLLAWVDWLFLTFTLAVVRFFAQVPFASVAVNVSPGGILAFYALLFGGTFVAAQPPERRADWRESLGRAFGIKAVATAGLVAVLLLGAVGASQPDGRLHVTFLDVPGGATLIRTPTGRHILVDAGESGRALSTELGDAMPFWNRRLDVVVLTGQAPEHLAGLPGAMERYRVEALVTGGERGESDAAVALWERVAESGVPVVAARPGTLVQTGDGVTLTVLSVPEGEGESLVVSVAYEQARVLLAGDLSDEGEMALLNGSYALGASVLQGQGGYGEVFLATVGPQIAVLTGENGELDAPGALVYRTAHDGTVHLATDGGRWLRWPRRAASEGR